MKKLTIIGLNGGFGVLFSKLLVSENLELVGTDLHPHAYEGCSDIHYFTTDILDLDTRLITELGDTDCVLFCLPEAVLLSVYTSILRILKAGTLVVDTLSVKSTIVGLGSDYDDLEILSLNPLFAPELGFTRQNVAGISLNPGNHTDIFIEYLKKWGAQVSILSAEAHDQLMAITQVVTHFSILCFGTCIKELDYKPDQVLFTPVHEVLLSLLDRIVSQNAEVYWNIQTDNPYAPMARDLFIESAKGLDEKISANDFDGFNQQLSAMDAITQEMRDDLKQKFLKHRAD